MSLGRRLFCDALLRQCVFDTDLDIIASLREAAAAPEPDHWPAYLAALKECDGPPPTRLPAIAWRAEDVKPRLRRFAVEIYTWNVVCLLVAACERLEHPHAAILADALEESGMNDPEIAAHLRRPHHAPSCYALMALVSDIPEDAPDPTPPQAA